MSVISDSVRHVLRIAALVRVRARCLLHDRLSTSVWYVGLLGAFHTAVMRKRLCVPILESHQRSDFK